MFICGKDVVRGVQAVTDPRLIAAMSEVPASYFQPPTDYFSPTVRSVHGVAEAANGATLYPATAGCRRNSFVGRIMEIPPRRP